MTQFAIVRHGVTDWNVEGRMQGHRDIPLNAMGLRQANQIAERLSQEHWDIIVYSDLLRASQTALCIADEVGIENRIMDPRLRERSFGEFEGTTSEERIEKWGADWKTTNSSVERDEELYARASQCMEQLADTYKDQKVIVVSHGGLISQFFKGIFPNEIMDHPNNTSLSIIHMNSGSWSCSLNNCTAHLDMG